jgi:hypothetical protein
MLGRRSFVVLLSLSIATAGCAGFSAEQLDQILRGDGPLDESTVAAGLKEALRIGTRRATDSTSQLDGFYRNALIRIVMPEQYQGVAKTLRQVGFGGKLDEFEIAMNRAAEKASGEAVDVFWTAITSMSIADAFAILNGNETAATDYFRRRTSAELHGRFQPIVINKMEAVGVYNIYNDLIGRYNQLPVEKPPAVNLEEYITTHAVDGIFTMLAGEEKKIREDPVARTTDLLRKVFGSKDKEPQIE